MTDRRWCRTLAGGLAVTLLLLGTANAVQFDVAPGMTVDKWLNYTGASLAKKVQVGGDRNGFTVIIIERKPGKVKVRIKAAEACRPGIRTVILTRATGGGAHSFNVYVVHKGKITDARGGNSAVKRTQERVLYVRGKTTAKFSIYGSDLGQWMKLVPQQNMQFHYGKGGFQQQRRGRHLVTDLVTDTRGAPVKAWRRGIRRAEVYTYIDRYSPGTPIYLRGMDGLANTVDGRLLHAQRVKINVVADDSIPTRMTAPILKSPTNGNNLGVVNEVELKWNPVTTTPVKGPSGKPFTDRVKYYIYVRYVASGSPLNQVTKSTSQVLWKQAPGWASGLGGVKGTTYTLKNPSGNRWVLWKVEARIRSTYDPTYGQIYRVVSPEFRFGTIPPG